jgi:hypothetical protein
VRRINGFSFSRSTRCLLSCGSAFSRSPCELGSGFFSPVYGDIRRTRTAVLGVLLLCVHTERGVSMAIEDAPHYPAHLRLRAQRLLVP